MNQDPSANSGPVNAPAAGDVQGGSPHLDRILQCLAAVDRGEDYPADGQPAPAPAVPGAAAPAGQLAPDTDGDRLKDILADPTFLGDLAAIGCDWNAERLQREYWKLRPVERRLLGTTLARLIERRVHIPAHLVPEITTGIALLFIFGPRLYHDIQADNAAAGNEPRPADTADHAKP